MLDEALYRVRSEGERSGARRYVVSPSLTPVSDAGFGATAIFDLDSEQAHRAFLAQRDQFFLLFQRRPLEKGGRFCLSRHPNQR